MSTRWDINNGICLCKGCHRFKVHIDTLVANQLIEKLKMERGKKWYKDLVEKSRQIIKFDMNDLKITYQNLKKKL